MTDFEEKVYDYVRKIPRGETRSYSDVARGINKPFACRAVGNALHKNPFFGEVPCHRVVHSDGSLCSSFAFGGIDVQAAMLREEGVIIEDNKVKTQRR